MTVTADSPLVDTTSKQIGGTVTSQELNDIPSINRNFTTYLGTLPGVTAFISTDSFGADSIRINGQGTQNVNYTLDGAGNNDTFNGGNGGAQARTPVEAVQEFQLLTSQFDAEFGASSGGVVNAVSKAGTNSLHGTAFFFDANDNMTARDFFAEKQNLKQAGDAADSVGRQHRRSDHQGQAPLLCQPRAHRSEPRHHTQHAGAARPERHHLHPRQRVELDGPHGPPDQRDQHLGRPMAEGDLTAVEPVSGRDQVDAEARARRKRIPIGRSWARSIP